MRPTEGKVSVNGKVIHKDMDFLPSAGIIIEEPGFFPNYSGFKNLKILAGIQNRISDEKIREMMEMVGLDSKMKKPVGKYSLGMRQRLGIAQAMMEDPEILILDEPTNGLDEDGVEWFRQFILEQKKKGKREGITVRMHSSNPSAVPCNAVLLSRISASSAASTPATA
jgi:ABC-2 type transport system ATP-binding protein